jgi:glycosyltransferase involved in cell wall biosynthesis
MTASETEPGVDHALAKPETRRPAQLRPVSGQPVAATGSSQRILLGSCVTGGPIQRLSFSLAESGLGSRVSHWFQPTEWRTLMAGSRLDRVRARAGSILWFPLKMLQESTQESNSAVIPTTNPFFLPAFLVATQWLHRKPVVPLVYDLYPDALESSALVAPGGFVDKLLTSMNRWWLRRAAGVVFIGEEMAEHVRQRYATPLRWTVIETGAQVSEFEQAPGVSESELERWCDGKRIISYVGNFGHVHEWETLSEAIPKVVTTRERVGVVIAASGVAVQHLKRRWATLSEATVRFEPPLSDRAWTRLLARSDIAISTLRSAAAKTSIPSKTFSAMAAGSAIVAVAPDSSDLSRLVLRHSCGEVVRPGDVDGLAALLVNLLESPEQLSLYKANASAAARDVYDMPKLARRWREFLAEVLPSLRA